MSTCTIGHTIEVNGKEVVSKLYKDLLTYSNHDKEFAKKAYARALELQPTQNFALDENNQPTLKSVMQKFDVFGKKEFNEVITGIKKSSKLLNKEGNDKVFSDKDSLKINDIIKDFRENNPMSERYSMVPIKVYYGDRGYEQIGWKIQIKPKTTLQSIEDSKVEYNNKLNEKIRDILQKAGVSIGALNALEQRLGVNGVMDIDSADKTVDGLKQLIRLAEGERGEAALPEEFAHLAFEVVENTALGQRLLNLLTGNKELIKDVLGENYAKYDEVYKGNEYLLAKEAIGKLITRAFDNPEANKDLSYKTLLGRLIETIKNFFKGLNRKGVITELTNAQSQVMTEVNNLSSTLFSNDFTKALERHVINLSNNKAVTSSALFSLDSQIKNTNKLLESIIKQAIIVDRAYSKRGRTTFNEKQVQLISELETYLEQGVDIVGIKHFFDNVLGKMHSIMKKVDDLRANPNFLNEVHESARVIRDAHNFVLGYKDTLSETKKLIRDLEVEGDTELKQEVEQTLLQIDSMMDKFMLDYKKLSIPLMIQTYRPFMKEYEAVMKESKVGLPKTLEELFESPGIDIGFFDRYLNSMADSSDVMSKLLDITVKKADSSARMKGIAYTKRLQAAQLKLEKSGIKNTEWMFRKDINGKPTGYFISAIDWTKFNAAYIQFKSKLDRDFAASENKNYAAYKLQLSEWEQANKELINGKLSPKLSIYGDAQFKNLNQAQKEYYDLVISLKEEAISSLPDKYNNTKFLAPQIHKDFLQRVQSAKNVKDGISTITEGAKDIFARREDDTQYGAVTNLKGEKIQVLPIHFISKLENMNDLSMDVTSTMSAYMGMFAEYEEMNKVVDVLELTRDFIKDRELMAVRRGNPVSQKIDHLGRVIERKVLKASEQSKLMARVDDFFESNVYKRYMEDEGKWGRISDVALVKYPALVNLSLNALTAITNVANATMMTNIETIAAKYFNAKDLAKADLLYGKMLPELMSQLNSRAKSSKLHLINEWISTVQGDEHEFKNPKMSQKGIVRFVANTPLSFLMSCGEHYVQSRVALAVLNTYMVKDSRGKKVSLLEALEVQPHENGKEFGGTLKLKEGYTKEDGSKFTEDDRFELETKIRSINKQINGSYNQADRAAIQRYSLGRAAMIFRRWMPGAYVRRFGKTGYNFESQEMKEGYYRTFGNFAWQLVKDLKDSKFLLGTRWKELDDYEKTNLKRAITEVTQFFLISLALALLGGGGGSDKPWLEQLAVYELRRLQTELGVLVPIQPSFFKQSLTIFQSPMAGVDTWSRVFDLMRVGEYGDVLQSGPYKGHTKFYKYVTGTIPGARAIDRLLEPAISSEFYKRQ